MQNWSEYLKTNRTLSFSLQMSAEIPMSESNVEETLREQVQAELDSGKTQAALMEKAIADSDGNISNARALYIDYRVQSIRNEQSGMTSGVNSSDASIVSLQIFLYVAALLIFTVICFVFVFLVLAVLVKISHLLPLGFNEATPGSWVSPTIKVSFLIALIPVFRAAKDEFGEFYEDVKDLKSYLKGMLPW